MGGTCRNFYGTISSLAHEMAPGHFAVAMNWAEENITSPPHPRVHTSLHPVTPLSYNNYYS